VNVAVRKLGRRESVCGVRVKVLILAIMTIDVPTSGGGKGVNPNNWCVNYNYHILTRISNNSKLFRAIQFKVGVYNNYNLLYDMLEHGNTQ